jgi:site-specific DNA-cytosine methylase
MLCTGCSGVQEPGMGWVQTKSENRKVKGVCNVCQEKREEKVSAMYARRNYNITNGSHTCCPGPCSGVGTAKYVLDKFRISCQELFAADSWPIAALACSRLGAQHVFTDVKHTTSGSGPCFVHFGGKCTIPLEQRLGADCYVAGFSCKPHSSARCDRFRKDNITPPGVNDQMDSYYRVYEHVKKTRPKTAVFENVMGILMRRGGCEVGESAAEFFEEDPQWGLQKLKDYTCARIRIDAVDGSLPTPRPRLYWILVRRDQRFTAAEVHTSISFLLQQVREVPVCHVQTFLDDPPGVGARLGPWASEPPVVGETERAQSALAYSQQFKKGIAECFANKRLPAEWTYPPVADRISARVDPDFKLPPFTRAAVDWGHEIIKSKLQATELYLAHPLGDINSSPSRFVVKMNGMCPTLTSRSTIFDFKREVILSNAEIFRIHGMNDIGHLDGIDYRDTTAHLHCLMSCETTSKIGCLGLIVTQPM